MKRFFILSVISVLFVPVFAQRHIDDNSVMLIVGTDTTTRGDFLKAYSQNITADMNTKPMRRDLEDYLRLYINFRLKIMDAKDSRYDTLQSLREELTVYRQQLAKPYVMDVKMQERMEKEAMEYIFYDVFARHILVALPMYPSPKDTLEAYKKIRMIREKLVKGENFSDVAFEYSDDVKPDRFGNKVKTGREGEMGYFTVLSMLYNIEEAVYTMKIGELSQPIRTRYGYHVVQLMDKKPALGKVTLAHILQPINTKDATPEQEAMARMQIEDAYKALQSGMSFAEAARTYSGDKQSAMKGGHMGAFAVNRMVPEVIAQLYSLRAGEYTKPFKSRFGWQIVQLIDKTGVPEKGEAIEMIRYGIEHGMDRGELPYKAFLDEKLKHSKWVWNEKNMEALKQYYKSLPTLKSISRDSSTNPKLFSSVLLHFEGQPHNVWEFLHSADKLTPNAKQVNSFENWFETMKLEYLRSAALQHEQGLLEDKYPEFRKLMHEYRDGVYLFEINNRKVWARALSDSSGLREFFTQNAARYQCPAMAHATVVSYDAVQTPTKEMDKFMQKAFEKKYPVWRIREEAERLFGSNRIKVDSAEYAPGDNAFVDRSSWEPGLSRNILSGNAKSSKKACVIIHEIIPSRPYLLSEVRGTVMNDYQAYLEQEWLKELKERYAVNLKKDVFESIMR